MKTHKILIIDDDPNDREIAQRLLLKADFEIKVEAVSHGEAALDLLQDDEELPSLIFLDLKMPGMDGLETLRRIRANERLKDITVIIASNSLLESDKKESYVAGADDFIQKAFDMDQFGRDIKSVLEHWLKE